MNEVTVLSFTLFRKSATKVCYLLLTSTFIEKYISKPASDTIGMASGVSVARDDLRAALRRPIGTRIESVEEAAKIDFDTLPVAIKFHHLLSTSNSSKGAPPDTTKNYIDRKLDDKFISSVAREGKERSEQSNEITYVIDFDSLAVFNFSLPSSCVGCLCALAPPAVETADW